MWELFPEGRIHKQQRSRGVISLKIFFPSTRKQELKSWWAYIFLRYYWCLLTIKHLIRAHTISSQTVMKGILFQLLLPLYGKCFCWKYLCGHVLYSTPSVCCCFWPKILIWSGISFYSTCLILPLSVWSQVLYSTLPVWFCLWPKISVWSQALYSTLSVCCFLWLKRPVWNQLWLYCFFPH